MVLLCMLSYFVNDKQVRNTIVGERYVHGRADIKA